MAVSCSGLGNARCRYVKDVPAQNNDFDCGVYAMLSAKHAAQRLPMLCNAADMPMKRVEIAGNLPSNHSKWAVVRGPAPDL